MIPGRRAPLLGGVGAVVLALALGIGTALSQAERNRLEAAQQFDQLAERVTAAVTARLRTYEFGLRGARGAVVAAPGLHIDRAAFARYSATRDLPREFPGARGFGVVWRVPADAETGFAARARADGWPDFALHQLAPHEGERWVIEAVEPVERNRAAIGLDIASEANRRQAAEAALRSGAATLTEPITLVQATGQPLRSFLLLLPIYRPGAPIATAAERADAAVGWTFAPLVIDEVLASLDTESAHYALSLRDRDGADPQAFYRSVEAPAGVDDDPVAAAGLRRGVALPVHGRIWEAELRATPAFVRSLNQTLPAQVGLIAALIGVLCSALVALVATAAARRRNEHNEQARRAAIVDGSADAIIGVDPAGLVTDWNGGAERLLGRSAAEARGRPVAALFVPADRADEHRAVHDAIARGERVAPFDTQRCRADGGRVEVSLAAAPIVTADGRAIGSALTLRDIGEERRSQRAVAELEAMRRAEGPLRETMARLEQQEASLRDAVRRAEQANRAKSQFLANMSHEIRTPMNAVIGLGYLLERTPLDAQQVATLAKIRVASRSLLGIINDVLDLSKIEASEMHLERAPFSPARLLAEVGDLMGVQAESKQIDFAVEAPADLPEAVEGDATRLHQVLVNLLSNAIKFTERGGVRLVVTTLPAEAGTLRLRFAACDTGIGIEPVALERLFRPFVQADASTTRRFGGTGLGLSIVKQLTALMGGTLAVESRVGAGSCFSVELDFPVCDAAAAAAVREAVAPAAGPSLVGVRVLVADDSPINLEVAERILALEGARVRRAGNGQEAADAVLAHPDGFDIVLMDVQMPVLDGLDATRRIRAGLGARRLPIVALTAGISPEEHLRAMAAGMSEVIAKPFEPAGLVRCMRRQLGSGAPPVERADGAGDVASGTTDAGARPRVDVDAEAGTPARRPWPEVPARTTPPDWPAVDGIDGAAAAERFAGDATLFCELLGRFLLDLAPSWRDADGAPIEGLAARLHRVKGTAGTLGATGLERLAAAAEVHAREASEAGTRTPERLSDALAELEAASGALSLAARPMLDAARRRADSRLAAAVAAPEAATLDPVAIRALLDHFDRCDFAALEAFRALAAPLHQRFGAAVYTMLRGQVEELRFDLAAATLRAAWQSTGEALPAH